MAASLMPALDTHRASPHPVPPGDLAANMSSEAVPRIENVMDVAQTLEFGAQLALLLSPEESSRQQADAFLRCMYQQNLPGLVLGLVSCFRHHPTPTTRTQAVVLFRKMLLSPIMHSVEGVATNQESTQLFLLEAPLQRLCKNELLEALRHESIRSVSRPICDTVAETFRRISLWSLEWPELIPSTFEFLRSGSALHREAGYYLLEHSSEPIAAQIGIGELLPLFEASLKESEPSEVQLACVKAFAALLVDPSCLRTLGDDITSERTKDPAQAAIGALLNRVLERILLLIAYLKQNINRAGYEATLTEILTALSYLAAVRGKYFRQVVHMLLDLASILIREHGMDQSVSNSALELILSIGESAPSMVRNRLPNICTELVPLCIDELASIQDDESWNTTYHTMENLGKNAAQALDRLALSFHGKFILPIAYNIIPRYLKCSEWEKRHAALSALSHITEGCQKDMEKDLPKILSELVIPHLKDPHPRVRYAALNTIGQLCADFDTDLQLQYHRPILVAIMPLLDDEKFPPVQAHAAAALSSFCQGAKAAHIEPHLSDLLGKFSVMLKSDRVFVQEQALTSLASVAQLVENQLTRTRYYSHLMPLLIHAAQEATSPEFEVLRGRALECISLIAIAVGRETFKPHIQPVLEVLVQIQREKAGISEILSPFLAATWARMCQVLGEDFQPYLDLVIPPLLEQANLRPQFKLIDPDETEADYDEADGWEIINTPGQRVAVRTKVLEDKRGALEKLVCYATELVGSFRKYAWQIQEFILPLLRFWDCGIRQAAAAIVPLLLHSVQQGGGDPVEVYAMWGATSDTILKIISEQVMTDVIEQMYHAYYECIRILGDDCLTGQQQASFVSATIETLKVLVAKAQARQRQKQDADFDEEELEDMEEEEHAESDCLHELHGAFEIVGEKTNGAFLSHIRPLLEMLPAFITSYTCIEGVRIAHLIYNSVIHFGGKDSFQYQHLFCDRLLEGLKSDDAEVRELSCIGIGECAQYAGAMYADLCEAAIPNLVGLLRHGKTVSGRHRPDTARLEPGDFGDGGCRGDDDVVGEHATIALRLIGQSLKNEEALRFWYEGMPLLQEVSHDCYHTLLRLVDMKHPVIFDPRKTLFESELRLASVMYQGLESGTLRDFALLQDELCDALEGLFLKSREVYEALLRTTTPDQVASVFAACSLPSGGRSKDSCGGVKDVVNEAASTHVRPWRAATWGQ